MNPIGKFIQDIELTEFHVYSKVTYVLTHAEGDASHPDCEGGRIRSWNNYGVFVDYTRNVCRTDFADLIWG